MELIRAFVRRYPGQSVLLVLLLLAGGIADGIGLGALLPLLDLAVQPDAAHSSLPEGIRGDLLRLLAGAGIEPSLGVLLALIVLALVLKSLFVLIAETRIGYIAADVATELRLGLLGAVMRSRWEYFVGQSAGVLSASIATEALRACSAYIHAVKVLALLIQAAVYAALALAVSWQATLACLVVAALILLASQQLVRIARRAGKSQTKSYRRLGGLMTDTLQSVKAFKAMGRDRFAEGVLAHEAGLLRGALRREVFGIAALEAAQEPMYAVVICAGIYAALTAFGVDLATVLFMVLVLARLLTQTGKVHKQLQKMLTCESAYWAMQDSIGAAVAAAEPAGGTGAPRLSRAIELDHVTFGYGDHRVLDDVSLQVPQGRLTCLVGGSGAGKTTIADLIIGLVQPQHGQVRVDGVPLDTLQRAAWRRSIGYVPQENLLLHDTVLHNVTLGDPELGAADAERALRAAGAWAFVSRMDGGLDAVVGERGGRLSGGQRQRVMIARALAHRPQLLILDEATSALDAQTEREICATLESLKGELTLLAVAHRSALVDIADQVYELADGRVVAGGATRATAAAGASGQP